MLAVLGSARLDREPELDLGDLQPRAVAGVEHLDDVRVRLGEEARIRQLTQLLRTAQVGEAPESSGVVEPGTVITAVIAGDEERFLIGSREIAGDSELDVFSESSPLGAAILGLKVGDSTSYTAPNGREIAVQVTGVETD